MKGGVYGKTPNDGYKSGTQNGNKMKINESIMVTKGAMPEPKARCVTGNTKWKKR